MTANKCYITLLLLFHAGLAFGAGPPLERLGQPLLLGTNCQIVWKAPSNSWPRTLCSYRVLPSDFSEATVSNLIHLGSFSRSEKCPNLGWQHGDTNAICYSNSKRSLGIYPRLGFIEYRFPAADDPKTIEGVPSDTEAPALATNYLRMLGIDTSQLAPQVNVIPAVLRIYEQNPFRIITNRHSCKVGFGRSLDGTDFFNRTEGCQIEFGHHATVAYIWMSWRNLNVYKKRPAADSQTIMKWMRQGKCIWQTHLTPPLDPPSFFQKITVNKVETYYYGEPREQPQDWVYPFAWLETVAALTEAGIQATGQSSLLVWVACPITEE